MDRCIFPDAAGGFFPATDDGPIPAASDGAAFADRRAAGHSDASPVYTLNTKDFRLSVTSSFLTIDIWIFKPRLLCDDDDDDDVNLFLVAF